MNISSQGEINLWIIVPTDLAQRNRIWIYSKVPNDTLTVCMWEKFANSLDYRHSYSNTCPLPEKQGEDYLFLFYFILLIIKPEFMIYQFNRLTLRLSTLYLWTPSSLPYHHNDFVEEKDQVGPIFFLSFFGCGTILTLSLLFKLI